MERWSGMVNATELQKAIEVLKPNHQLFEIRILGADKRKVLSGYFTDAETLLSALDAVDMRNQNLYITLNRLNSALYSRVQHDHFKANVNTTTDTEVLSYEWFFIDFDPERPTNISSSNDELKEAEKLKNTVRDYLTDLGFHAPVEALSGNGYHLLYRIDLPCNEENKRLLNSCLETLANKYNNKTVKIDTVNFNPGRICKLYGTMAQKGFSSKDRPHRMSKIIYAPANPKVNGIDLLKKIGTLPEKPTRQKASSVQQEFDVRNWLIQNGLTYTERTGDGCQMLLLDECPFDSSHTNGDSKVFVYTNGAIAFKCHHNSCAGKTWQDVRLKYEPDAYDQKDDEHIEKGYQRHKKQLANAAEFIPMQGEVTPKQKKKRVLRKLKTAESLMEKELPEPKVYVGVDDELPILVEGTCILSAKPKLGKSWFALSLCLAVAEGKDFLGYKTNKCSVLYLDLETSETIQKKRLKKALKDAPVPKNFYLETETDPINNGFIEQIEAYMAEDPNIGVVVIDVFQIIRSPAASQKESDYEHAYRDITPLNELAQKYHISIILVCHDRKAVDPDDPFTNILGSTGLQGAATQMIVMFRKKKEDPIHISVKGKTIDGLPDLNVKLENAEWSITEKLNDAEAEKARAMNEYLDSQIRKAVLEVVYFNDTWQGRSSELIQAAVNLNVPIEDSPKEVGGFLHRHVGRFLAQDHIKIQPINNGTGAKSYKLSKVTVDTVDENEQLPLMEWEKVAKQSTFETMFS